MQAMRELLTPYMSEGPYPPYQLTERKKRKRKTVQEKRGTSNLGQ